MHAEPFFSVVIPVHNRANTIAPTLASVQAQTDGDWECIVVDDGSADGTELEAVIASLGDSRIRCIRQPNGGGGAARNTGIRAARGRYVAFLDSDDFFVPGKLAACREYLRAHPGQAIYSQVYADRGVGRMWARPDRAIRPDEDVGEYLFVANQLIQTSSIVLPREAALATLFDPALRKGQDLDFCLRLQRDGVRFVMLPEPLAIWTDYADAGRTSHIQGYQQPLDWLQRSRELLTRRAYLGYRATVLAYYMARSRPFRAALDLLLGLVTAGVAPKVIARQVLRSYMPRSWYRALVGRFVAVAGRSVS